MEQMEIFRGKYIIHDTLGGGSGRVFLAENTALGTFWAIKRLNKDNNEMSVEPEILKRLDHPCLPRIFDVAEDSRYIYIIMEYIKGNSLDKLVAKKGRIDEILVIQWAIKICDVLTYLHEMKPSPIIHRDIKPSNLIFTDSNELKVIDFGTAREFKDSSCVDTIFIGTRGYAAPEQYGGGQTSPASDIFSLGATMHNLLTGVNPNTPPYRFMPVREYSPEVSNHTEEIILKCTRSDPSERYSTAIELKNALVKASTIKENKENSSRLELNRFQNYSSRVERRVITVWDNSEFACELAYTAAQLSGMNILIADLDLLSPSVDVYLNVRKYPGNISGSGLLGNTGLNIVLESAEKKVLEPELIRKASIKRRELCNLYILTGCYNLEDYEYYSNEALISFLECAVRSFDLTILAVNRSIYDLFTILSLARSDINIIALPPRIREFRDCNNWISHLKQKQKIPSDKYKTVIFDWDPVINWQKEFAQKVMGAKLIGLIRKSRLRERYRSLKAAYVQKMEREVVEDYRHILSYIGLTPRKNIIAVLFDQIKKLLTIKKGVNNKYPFIAKRKNIQGGGEICAGNSNTEQHCQV